MSESFTPTPAAPTLPLDTTRLVTVCSECLRASCWHGEFMCDRSQSACAGVVNVSVDELRKLDREHPDNWSAAKMAEVYGVDSRPHRRALGLTRERCAHCGEVRHG